MKEKEEDEHQKQEEEEEEQKYMSRTGRFRKEEPATGTQQGLPDWDWSSHDEKRCPEGGQKREKSGEKGEEDHVTICKW